MPTSQRKALAEEFARFYENPDRENLRALLQHNVGELRNIDFKAEWPMSSKLAKHALGFANAGGGVLVIGVCETDDKTLDPVGLKTLKDKAAIVGGLKRFLPHQLLAQTEILDFAYEASEYPRLVGRKFQVLVIPSDERHLPYVALADGEDIRTNAIYVRRGAATVEATHDELQELISQRLGTGHSSRVGDDLVAHLEQLQVLHGYLPFGVDFSFRSTQKLLYPLTVFSSPDTDDRAETFNEFVARSIARKKRLIEQLLGFNSQA